MRSTQMVISSQLGSVGRVPVGPGVVEQGVVGLSIVVVQAS